MGRLPLLLPPGRRFFRGGGATTKWPVHQWSASEPPEPARRGPHAVWRDLCRQRGVRQWAFADRRAGGDSACVRRVAAVAPTSRVRVGRLPRCPSRRRRAVGAFGASLPRACLTWRVDVGFSTKGACTACASFYFLLPSPLREDHLAVQTGSGVCGARLSNGGHRGLRSPGLTG